MASHPVAIAGAETEMDALNQRFDHINKKEVELKQIADIFTKHDSYF